MPYSAMNSNELKSESKIKDKVKLTCTLNLFRRGKKGKKSATPMENEVQNESVVVETITKKQRKLGVSEKCEADRKMIQEELKDVIRNECIDEISIF